MFGAWLTASKICNRTASWQNQLCIVLHVHCGAEPWCAASAMMQKLITPPFLCVQQREAEEEEEDEQEVLALPAPGDYLSQEGQLEAEMHAAIASAELVSYAQVGLSTYSPLHPPPSLPTPPPPSPLPPKRAIY